MDLPGPSKMRRFTMDGENHFPIWSADGLRLLFISVRNGMPAIYWQPAAGGAAEQLTATARAPESVSAPVQMLSYITLNTAGGTADYDIWTYSFRDRKSAPLIQIRNSAQHSSRFSPDGKWLAYISDETGRLELYVQPFPPTGAIFQITKTGGGHPLWSPDGQQLYFDNSGRLFSVAIRTAPTFSSGVPVSLPIGGFIQGAGNYRRQYDMTPDGKQFVMLFAPSAPLAPARGR
jgi:Tol biopolymer transport system component